MATRKNPCLVQDCLLELFGLVLVYYFHGHCDRVVGGSKVFSFYPILVLHDNRHDARPSLIASLPPLPLQAGQKVRRKTLDEISKQRQQGDSGQHHSDTETVKISKTA